MRRLVFAVAARSICRKLGAQLPAFAALQQQQLQELLVQGRPTSYGRAFGFSSVRTYADFRKATPLIRYETLRPYTDRIAAGENDVLWPGLPDYFALSSGTSSGIKHIPVTQAALLSQRRGRMLHGANFTERLGLGAVHSGRLILFADSHHFVKHGCIPSAAISAILSSTLPWYVKQRDFPSPQTQQLSNYDEKVTAMVRETMGKKITGIVALPPWLLLFLERVETISGKPFSETYPDFQLLSTSGMSFEPYRQRVEELIGKPFVHLQTYPASEGFFGFQYDAGDPSMLLLPHNGIFYEFVREETLHEAQPQRYCISEVETGVRYALVITTNAGLWGYLPGDIVEFTSLQPPKIRIAGREGNILNVFGEHLTTDECETLIAQVCREQNCSITDFALTPVMQQAGELPHHRWLIEFSKAPADLPAFAAHLDALLVAKNLCYRDLIRGKAMQPLKIKMLSKGAFTRAMAAGGKTGAQQKTKRFPGTESVRLLEAE